MNQVQNRTVLVTGAAGFVGSHLTDRLLELGNTVIGIDNFSRGTQGNLSRSLLDAGFRFFETNVADLNALRNIFSSYQIDTVWHMVANSDIGAGVADPNVDLKDTFLSTFNVLAAMREANIRNIAFASTSAVYGVHEQTLEENIGPLFPISNYGAMKLASEALISAAVESYLERAWIFRFPNVIGPRATHGIIFDLLTKLSRQPTDLEVLGDGTQQKPYLHVSELIEAMLWICEHAKDPLNWFNIGPPDEGTTVKEIAEAVQKEAAPATPIRFTGGNKGWVGDVPKFRYSIEKLRRLGWSPQLTSRQAVERAVQEIHAEFQRAIPCSS
ncbi:MAG TPA: NAD-dependent epimerase/dehydratase family protein [Bryobacteraceae bacterium]|jgi:UDP-glucose 4-epimerase